MRLSGFVHFEHSYTQIYNLHPLRFLSKCQHLLLLMSIFWPFSSCFSQYPPFAYYNLGATIIQEGWLFSLFQIFYWDLKVLKAQKIQFRRPQAQPNPPKSWLLFANSSRYNWLLPSGSPPTIQFQLCEQWLQESFSLGFHLYRCWWSLHQGLNLTSH